MVSRAHIDTAAIRHNADLVCRHVGEAALCAVVKADGYGHGAAVTAEAALAGGATWLAVATPAEAVGLKQSGIGPDVPILILSEPPADDLLACSEDLPRRVRLTVSSSAGLAAIERAGRVRAVHLQVDTGMHRRGADPDGAVALARAVVDSDLATLEGMWSHFAVADRPADDFTVEQTRRFDASVAKVRAAGIDPGLLHLCNTGGAIAHPAAWRDMVRVGIALYGVGPDPAAPVALDLRPALRLTTPVTAIRTVAAGESVSYGRHWFAESATTVATLGLGYADGIRRDSPAAGVEVLVRGRRRPMLGVVTMDQLMIAVDDDVTVGDEAVLIGSQGSEEISANEIAARLGTIGYEVLTSLGPRIVREVGV